MSLAFLYPLLWLGALAAAAPLWLHLRRRSETSVVRFSAVQFLDEQPLARHNPLRVRDPLLLLLRLLALLLLVAAFAWPYRASENSLAVSESRVYILDNSLSHQAANRFPAAQQRLVRELSELPRDTQLAVIELAATPRVVVTLGDAREVAQAAVAKLTPSSQRGSFLAAFRAAGTLLNSALGQRRTVVLLSDSQRNQWTEEADVAPFLSNVEVVLPEVEQPALANVAVGEPRLRRVFLGDRVRLECAVKVARQGPINQTQVTLKVNGEELGQRLIKFDEQTQVVQFELQWEAPPGDWIRGEIQATSAGDALPADDRCFFGLAPVQEGRVAVLARSPYLRTALSPDVMAGRWNTAVWDEPPWQQAPPPDADVLCLGSHYLQAAVTRELVQSYLRRGQGVVLFLDQLGPAVGAFLREFHLDPRSVVGQRAGATTFQYVFADHPVFQPFRSADFGNLLEVQFAGYRRLALGDALPLAFARGGDPLLCQVPTARGTLLVAAFGADRADTNWPVHPTFVPFLDLCLQHARSKSTLPAEALPAEHCVWTVPESGPEAELVIGDAPGDVVRAPIRVDRVEFQAPATPGVYAVRLGREATPTHLLQVNVPPEESDLTFQDARAQVAAWCLPAAATAAQASEDRTAVELTQAEILSQTWWWWLLLAAVALLVAESCWVGSGRSFARRER